MKVPAHKTKNCIVYADNSLPPRWSVNDLQ